MSNTPLQLEILVHYYGHADDYRFGDFSAPAVDEAIRWFIDDVQMLKRKEPGTYDYPHASIELTDRGRFFVEALCAVPYPVPFWMIPQEAA